MNDFGKNSSKYISPVKLLNGFESPYNTGKPINSQDSGNVDMY